MINIKKLNKISPIIYDYLDKEQYNVTSDLPDNDCEGMIVRSADCHSLELSGKLLAIARAGAGTNNIPIDACSEKGIVVFNTPGANANGVKELVLGTMISASRNLPEAYDWAKTLKGQEDVPKLVEKGKGQFVGCELKGKTLGVIGLGAIGVMVANVAAAIGMNVIGYDPYLSVDRAWTLSTKTHKAEKLDDLLAQSDFISIHVPQTEKTKNYLSTPEFGKMKKGVILLNFSRDGLVKTSSLMDAIEDGTVAKYVTDFPDNHMLCHEKILAIPHLGASTPESEENCAVMAAQQLHDFFATGTIVNSVNMPECIVSPSAAQTVTIIHKNLPGIVGQIANLIAKYNVNIGDMANKSRGDMAYTVLNLDSDITDEAIHELSGIEGVIKVRII